MRRHIPLALVAILAACTRGSQTSQAVTAIPGGPLPLKLPAQATVPAIAAADLMSRLYVFADDSMQGRETGTAGHERSTAWLAAQLAALGLEPAGENGTFFQNMPMALRRFDSTAVLSVGGRRLVPFSEFVPLAGRGSQRSIQGAQAVYAGTLGDTVNVVPASTLEGKAVVYRAASLAGLQRAGASVIARAPNAAAVVVVVDELPVAIVQQARQPSVAAVAGGSPQPAVMLLTTAAAEALFGAPLTSVMPGSVGNAFNGGITYAEADAPARNVVAVLRGSDPALRNTYVAVGAHSDHVGFRVGTSWDHDSLRYVNTVRSRLRQSFGDQMTPDQVRQMQQQLAGLTVPIDSLRRLRPARRDSIFNGADDDGSGSVAVLEIAEALVRAPTKPKRSILFVWHTGEEKGLLGSRWYTDHPTVPRDSIVAQLNMDMVGRGEAGDIKGGGPAYLQIIGSRRLSTELGDLIEGVNRAQSRPFTFDYSWDANGHPENIYCRSDHYSYARWGIPVAFFTTGLHQDYHQATDEPQYIDYPHMARVAQLVHDAVQRVANLDHRPVVDKPKPDPNGRCRQ